MGKMQREKGKAICAVEGCGKPVHGRGLCNTHYANQVRIGHPVAPQVYERRSGVRRDASEVECAYFAGYFDGEGCITIAPRQSGGYYARVDFGQTNPTVLIALEAIYGGALSTLPGKGNRRPQTRWRLARAASVRKFLEDIRPFVREKRDQVIAILDRFFVEHPSDVDGLIVEISEMKRRAYGSDAAS